MKDAIRKEEKGTPTRGQSTDEDSISRLRQLLAEQGAQLRFSELNRERLSADLKSQEQQFARLSKSPLYRLFDKIQALDTHDISGKAFYLAREAKRIKLRWKRKALLRKSRLEYAPIFVARGASIHGQSSFSELIPAGDLPQKIVYLDSPSAIFTYSFLCGFDGLSVVGFAFDTSKVKSNPSVKLRVAHGDLTIHEVTCSTKEIATHGIHLFSFGPILRSSGNTYTVTISSPDGRAGDALGVVLFGERPSHMPAISVNKEVALSDEAKERSFNPCFVADARGGHETHSIGWVASKVPTQFVPLYGDRVASFSFETPKNPLTSVSVIFNTFSRYTFTDICVEIRADSINVWQGSFSTEELEDQEPFALPIPESVFEAVRNKRVTIALSSPKAGSDQFMFILGTPIFAVGGEETSTFKSGVNYNEIVRSSLDGSSGAPVFRDVFRQTPLRLRIAILEGPRAKRDQLRPQLVKLFANFVDVGHDCILYPQDDLKSLVGYLRDSDIVIVPDQEYSEALREVVTEVRMSYGIVIGLPEGEGRTSKLLEACGVSLSTPSFIDGSQRCISDVVGTHRATYDLSVSIVTVLYRKEREIPLFLECLAQQDFNGATELVVVNDCSPDRSKEVLISSYEALERKGYALPQLKIIDNLQNLGNCGSRNRALREVTGDVVVVVDADCLLNKNFVSAHVHAHSFHGASVVIGPCNLESGLADPMARLKEYEASPARVRIEAELQDPINLDSFVNCITRNFSIRRSEISEELFDEKFGYSANPDSGFGWEDVEMGYRLYKRGLKIHFTRQAISVHVSHPSNTDDKAKPLKSLKNFRRLVEKHPSITLDARRWFQDTFGKIEQWSAACGHPVNEDQRFIREKLGEFYPYPFAIRRNAPLRVVTYRWHVPHQYELYKLPHAFTLLQGLGTGFTNGWNFEQRPLPANAIFKPVSKFKKRDADLAILHFDENVLLPENCNGIISGDWGDNFKFFMEHIKGLPKVAVCHGTPQFVGQYNPAYEGDDLGTPIESSRKLMVDYLGYTPVVCNSHQALREWGFKNSRVIWQGFDPSEFHITNYEGGILTLGKAIKERPYYRGYKHYLRVCEILPKEFQPEHHSVKRPLLGITDTDRFARLKYEEYKDSLRRYSVYFNPTIRSPMPRSRGEAMMSGLVTVSAANHDVEMFIKNGWNGFYADTPEEMAEHLLFLMKNKKACREMGQRARETAADLFNHDRYLAAWQKLIQEVVGR
jgi:glycosyltransferase involved in cell wall biosynthesis